MASRVKLRERLVVSACFNSKMFRCVRLWRSTDLVLHVLIPILNEKLGGFRARMPCHLFSLRCLILGSQASHPKQQFGALDI